MTHETSAAFCQMSRFVSLLRVSSKSQGHDGHGIAAQRRDINLFLQQQECPEVIAELVEVESGASTERPVLEEALALCRKHSAALLVQKVDRITRDMEVLARIVKDKQVDLRVASLPNADNFQIHLFGCLAAQEREFISQRTKAALASAKERGVQLGTAGARNIKKANEAKISAANSFALKIQPLVEPLRDAGKTFQEIANILNGMGIKTPQGKCFQATQVRRYTLRFA